MKPVRAKDFYKKQRRIQKVLDIAFGFTIAAILFIACYGFITFKLWEKF